MGHSWVLHLHQGPPPGAAVGRGHLDNPAAGCVLGPRIWPPSVGAPSQPQPALSWPADPLPPAHSPLGSQAHRLHGTSEFIGPKLRMVRL